MTRSKVINHYYQLLLLLLWLIFQSSELSHTNLALVLVQSVSGIIFRRYISYEKKNYSMATVVFLFLFFPTHFANLKFTSNDHLLMFKLWHALWGSWLWSVISQSVLVGAISFFENLYGKVTIDQFQIFRRPKSFRREKICKKPTANAKICLRLVVELQQSISTLCLRWVPLSVELLQTQLFLGTLLVWKTFGFLWWNFSGKFCEQCLKILCYPLMSSLARRPCTLIGFNHSLISCEWSNITYGASVYSSLLPFDQVRESSGKIPKNQSFSSFGWKPETYLKNV